MVQETRLALQNISEEAEFARISIKRLSETPSVPGASIGSQIPLEKP
jgi:hypothetical protein